MACNQLRTLHGASHHHTTTPPHPASSGASLVLPPSGMEGQGCEECECPWSVETRSTHVVPSVSRGWDPAVGRCWLPNRMFPAGSATAGNSRNELLRFQDKPHRFPQGRGSGQAWSLGQTLTCRVVFSRLFHKSVFQAEGLCFLSQSNRFL